MQKWILSLCWFMAGSALIAAEGNQPQVDFFESKIRPVLVEHCYECHSSQSKEVMGGLVLDSREGIRQGGESGPAVVPADAENSLILSALRYEDFEMPPKGKLPDHVIADFDQWIRRGATDPRDGSTFAHDPDDMEVRIAEAKESWAFSVPTRKRLPRVDNRDWPSNRIDYFVLHRLESNGFSPAREKAMHGWIRRISFDLTGLPPSKDLVDEFTTGRRIAAKEELVDRLLASPRFGEHWSRMWLDVARYAEDQAHIVGNNESLFYPNAYLYRDWVIAALNSDMPFDRFVSLQLAADLIEPVDDIHLPALGFLGLGPKYYNRGRLDVKADEWEDRVDTVSRGLLGLTVACARCHDHKYDPISTEDYYGLAGIFASTKMFNKPIVNSDKKDDGQSKSPKSAMHIVEESDPMDLNVFIRGNVEQKGPLVRRRFPLVLCKGQTNEITSGSGRKQLAESIISKANPLTSRVIVNRVFGQMIGRAIVATPSNFGVLGSPPTHPDLLDDLAVRFMENQWSLKWLVREIALSSTYDQTSRVPTERIVADPENKWLGRGIRKRLSVEAWRDSLLAVTGQLGHRIGGPSFKDLDSEQHRRTLYVFVSRFQPESLLAMFDFPMQMCIRHGVRKQQHRCRSFT